MVNLKIGKKRKTEENRKKDNLRNLRRAGIKKLKGEC